MKRNQYAIACKSEGSKWTWGAITEKIQNMSKHLKYTYTLNTRLQVYLLNIYLMISL